MTSQQQNAVLVSAPGKVILFGEHAVVYGKPAIAASLGLRTYSWIRRTNDSNVRLNLPDIHTLAITWESRVLAELAAAHYRASDWATPAVLTPESETALSALIEGVTTPSVRQATLAFLHLYLSICKGRSDLDTCVRSALPVGAGLGSSASYSVTIAAGLFALGGYGDDPALVNGWAFMAEKVIHGNPSGVDNSLATYGGAKVYSHGKLEALGGFGSLRFMLTDTRVPKNTKRQVELVRERKLRFPLAMDLLIDSVQGIVEECKSLFLDVEQKRVSEDEMLTAMEALIDMNHGIMSACGVSHPSLEMVRLVTASHGLRSKLTGAGGGGCALTLIRPDTTRETLDTIKERLHLEGFMCFETEVGGVGVTVRSDPDACAWDSFADLPAAEWASLVSTLDKP
ncbi:ribosomal protein S5 domain 2-type protein [Powellomyces hirtus]|nr:ribosomal protein S5 domain 2-type protein [Powellomyces hirtus]